MGSIQESIVCPQCGHMEAYCTYYYKTGEEYIFCPLCGYQKENTIKCNEKGGWLMQTDVYEIDGKTVGYSRLVDPAGADLLSDFTPFTPECAAEELKAIEKKRGVCTDKCPKPLKTLGFSVKKSEFTPDLRHKQSA